MAKEDPKKAAQDIEDSFSSLRDTLRSIGEELGVNINKITEAKKEYRSLLDIAKQLQNNEEEIVKLSDRQVKTLRSKAESSLRDLKVTAQKLAQEKGIVDISKTNLKFRKDLTDEQFSLLSALQDNFSVETQIVNELGKEDDLRDSINKKTGILGGILKGISKIPILGNVFDAEQALDASRDKIRETGSAVSGLGASFKNIGKQIVGGVLNPANLVLGTFTLITKTFLELDKAAGDFAKSQNMTYQEALKARESYASLVASSGDMSLNARDLMETQSVIGEQLGTNAKLNEADLKTFTKLRKQAGYTNEELMGIQQLSLVNGKSLEQNTKEILGGAKAYASRNKMVVNEKQVLKEVSKASAALKLSLGGSTKAIAEAVVQAKKFGLTLEQTEKMSQSLLNFEESIESELSAELLTGKDLNLERARGLALNGKTAEAAAEIAAQVGSSAEFGKMNVIQQEAIAKAIGMERNELAQSLIDKEALAKIGFKDAEAAKAKYEELRKTMTAEEAAAALGDDQLAKQYEQQSNAEKFAQTIEHVKEIFVSIVDGPMGSILSMIGELLKNSKVVYGVFGALAALLGGKMLVSLVQTITKLGVMVAQAVAYAAAWAIANPITALVGLGVAAGVGTMVYAQMKDGAIDPKGGLIVSGEKGSIQLDPKDSIIAGTDLIPKNMKDGTIDSKGNATSQGEKGSIKVQAAGGGNDMSAVISAINALANRPINISIDGKKVIEATTGANPNTAGDENRKNSYKVS